MHCVILENMEALYPIQILQAVVATIISTTQIQAAAYLTVATLAT